MALVIIKISVIVIIVIKKVTIDLLNIGGIIYDKNNCRTSTRKSFN